MIALSVHTCEPCGQPVPVTVPILIEEPSGPGTTKRLCPMHAAGIIAEDPDRRALATQALDRLGEAMLTWPAEGAAISAEVNPRQVVLRVETDYGESVPPLMQCVTVAPGEDSSLWFWFLWLPDRFARTGQPVLHPVGPISDIERARSKLGVMVALL